MSKQKPIIGCHVSMKAPDYLIGSLKQAQSYGANALMIYTGPPQNTMRKDLNAIFIPEFQKQVQEANILLSSVIVHAPYLINLANTRKQDTFQFSVDLLISEIARTEAIGATTIVLHPGSGVGADKQVALDQIVRGLDAVCKPEQKVRIALETMAGKGSEVGSTFEELAYIINNVKHKELIGVCFDTCHVYDSGYDIVKNLEEVIQKFDKVIGLDKLLVLHINDSKFGLESHKDRHDNIGMGQIGFETISKIIYHPLLIEKIKILETPWINDKAPYGIEIQMILDQQFDEQKLLDLKDNT